MNTADLAPLMQPKSEPGPSMDVRYRQGTVRFFNPDTLENVVDVGGTLLINLPLLGVAEASSLVVGAVVGLLAIESTEGLTTYAILGRLVTPGTAAAVEAISLLSSWVRAESVAIQESTTSSTFANLTTVGPTVTITVRATGRLLLFVTSQIQWQDPDTPDAGGGLATVELTGANVIAPTTMYPKLSVNAAFALNPTGADAFQGTYTASVVVDGLNPGPTTIQMKYRVQTIGEQTDFGRRSLVAISL